MRKATFKKEKNLKCSTVFTEKLILTEKSGVIPECKYENVERKNNSKNDYTL